MTDGFKQSLSQINTIMWVTLSLSVSLLFLDVNNPSPTILGISVNGSRLLVIAPIALVGLLVIRQLYIKNVIEIIRRAEDKSELKEIVLAYPLIEFMRWRFTFGAEVVLLTAFQVAIDLLPAISLLTLWFILKGQGARVPVVFRVATFVLVFLALWNYVSLRRKVFESLVGGIGTPD